MTLQHTTSEDTPVDSVARERSTGPAFSRIPWSFRLASFLVRHKVAGGYRLLDMIRRFGFLDRVVRYQLSERVAIDIPLFREDNCFDAMEIKTYESHLMEMLGRFVPKLIDRVRLIDGGADIGLFTMRLVAAHSNIKSVYAIEPNVMANGWLYRNLNMLPVDSHPLCAALGEFTDRGELRSPDYDPSDHGKYISPCPGGAVSILRIDNLANADSDESLVLKLDVEGAELAALLGAQTTIARAKQVVVTMEAHPRVAKRTGIDPVECLRLLNSIRPFEFHVAERPEVWLSLNRNLFEQLETSRNYNIVAVSLGPRGGGS